MNSIYWMFIAEINSTNDYLRLHPDVPLVRTDFQTAGRGQRGNGWESERGKNLLFSIRLSEMHFRADEQWKINMLVATALWETIQAELSSDALTIKWPNDIYYADRKLAGILVENTLCGGVVSDSIAGIGLNVNQTEWHSDATNPVSLKQITGKEYEAEKIMRSFVNRLHQDLSVVREKYMSHLYRREGYWWWEEREVSLAPTMNGQYSEHSFEARIADITALGELVLQTKQNERKIYHFKQIKYIL